MQNEKHHEPTHIAIVSGGSRGIGRTIARSLIADGMNVAIAARGDDGLKDAREEFGDRCSTHSFDVEKADECERLVSEVVSAWGGVDHLITCAGSGKSLPPGMETADEWRRMIDVNFLSATNMISYALPELRKRKGSIVCISSICGHEALGAPVPYSASKAALNAMVNGLARPLGRDGVRINAVSPGNIYFEGSVWEAKSTSDPLGLQRMLEAEVPLRRLGAPEEVADAVCFLLSEKASFISGERLVVDGGQLRS
jgi:3-oxoacyl-[acyl-carrier protein] reductase